MPKMTTKSEQKKTVLVDGELVELPADFQGIPTMVPVRQADESAIQALADVISLWADRTTDSTSARRADLRRDKSNAVLDFFQFTGKLPADVTPLDVKVWQAELEKTLAPATVYAKVSRVSSFYKWAIEHSGGLVEHNPVASARPKAPKAYQTEGTESLDDTEVKKLLDLVKAKADAGSISATRDFAMLLFYFFTGKRRSEIVSLKWGDLRFNGVVVVKSVVKGGDYETFEVADPGAKNALFDYLKAAGRLEEMTPDTPLWTAHDRTGQHTGKALSSHAFVKNLKKYAKDAGIGDIHLHQTRHTFARWAGEESGSVLEVQEALGHKNAATTRVYLKRVSVKKDKFSAKIAERLGVNSENS